MQIADLLSTDHPSRPTAVVTCDAGETVRDAVGALARHKVGAIVVRSGDRVVGVFSERDVVAGLDDQGAAFLDRTLSETMVETVVVVAPDESVDTALAVMKEKNIRHLPVVAEDSLVGIVSLRDLAFCSIDRATDKVDFLTAQVSVLQRPLPM
jgi:CBS domain-containing protein